MVCLCFFLFGVFFLESEERRGGREGGRETKARLRTRGKNSRCCTKTHRPDFELPARIQVLDAEQGVPGRRRRRPRRRVGAAAAAGWISGGGSRSSGHSGAAPPPAPAACGLLRPRAGFDPGQLVSQSAALEPGGAGRHGHAQVGGELLALRGGGVLLLCFFSSFFRVFLSSAVDRFHRNDGRARAG